MSKRIQNSSSDLKFNIVASWTMMILCGISLLLDLGSLGFVLIGGFFGASLTIEPV